MITRLLNNCCLFPFGEQLLLFFLYRSEKDKRSSYAPEKGYRYDGVYRIEKCWRKAGIQVIFFLELMQAYCRIPLAILFSDWSTSFGP